MFICLFVYLFGMASPEYGCPGLPTLSIAHYLLPRIECISYSPWARIGHRAPPTIHGNKYGFQNGRQENLICTISPVLIDMGS